MAEYLIQGATLTALADAIRTKTGGTNVLTLEQMVGEIASIGYEDEINGGGIAMSATGYNILQSSANFNFTQISVSATGSLSETNE